ncbi:MAG: glutaredoxin [Tissierellia bacterium]|nr:glutaredoxin [Tissierellia bacterium]
MERLIEDENLNVEVIDISKSKNYVKELVELGGKRQVPCLDINGEAMYESKTIFQWLEEHKEELR